jgi:uncharacterized coiled-coil protein SlyX
MTDADRVAKLERRVAELEQQVATQRSDPAWPRTPRERITGLEEQVATLYEAFLRVLRAYNAEREGHVAGVVASGPWVVTGTVNGEVEQ